MKLGITININLIFELLAENVSSNWDISPFYLLNKKQCEEFLKFLIQVCNRFYVKNVFDINLPALLIKISMLEKLSRIVSTQVFTLSSFSKSACTIVTCGFPVCLKISFAKA